MKIVIDYITDDENMSDEDYENQDEKTIEITASDLIEIMTYGRTNKHLTLDRHTQSIGEILDIRVES